MKFQDLSEFDLKLIKDLAVQAYVNTSVKDRFRALTDSTIGCISSKGYEIVGNHGDLLRASQLAGTRPETSHPFMTSEEIIENVFKILESHNLILVRDENATPTWTTPKESWYTKAESYRKPWTY